MTILVDTPVWSLALRRSIPPSHPLADELRELVRRSQAHLIGPVRQEILSGIRQRAHFERVRNHLRAFPDIPLTAEDHERAAELFNVCRAEGVQGSNTDFLLCAVAELRHMAILTTDEDFTFYSRHIPVSLHTPKAKA